MIKKRIYIFLLIFLLIATACIILLPVFRPGFLITDDGDWMIIRLSAFYQSLREGQFPIRFLGRLNQSYGYPVANFLYPGFMYLGSIIHFIGFSFQTTIEIILISSVVVGSCFTFFWLHQQFSKIASLIGALTYVLMPYLLFNIFKRGSIGEVLALGVLPIALYAIESKNKWLLAPVIAFLAISHNTLALFFLPILCCYIVIKKYWSILTSFLLGVGMSAFFWIPAFFERTYVRFNAVEISNPEAYFPISHTVLFWSVPILLAVCVLLLTKKLKKRSELWFFIAILGMSTFFASQASIYFWHIDNFVKFVQFPFRWLSIYLLAGPWIIAYLMDVYRKEKVIIALTVISVFSSYWITSYASTQSVIHPEGYFTTNEATTTVKDEYMPRWVSKQMDERVKRRIEFYEGRGVIEEKKITTQRLDVIIHAEEPSIIQINTVYYPGWGAMLDNERAKIEYENVYGLMRISVPAGDHSLFMEFRETPSRFIADAISLFFGFLYLYSLVALNRSRHMKTQIKKK